MKDLLDLWINNEKNFIVRFIKRKLLNLFEPLFSYQCSFQEELMHKLKEKETQIEELQQKTDALIPENSLLKSELDAINSRIIDLRINDRLENLEINVRSTNDWISKVRPLLCQDDPYSLVDYTDFEKYFRGSVELIKDRQREYLKYFSECRHVVDIGCGRGEFLSLLQETNINAEGVELYKPYVDFCNNSGLKVHLASGIDFLSSLSANSIDGIYMGQVVEHLSIKDLITMIQLAYEKLAVGSYLIMETPNPMTLAIFTHAFYIDPSHNKPVHPLLLQYLAKKAGFQEASIVLLPKSKLPEEFPKIISSAIDNLEEVNNGIEKLSNLLYGCQDYAIIAQKK